MSEWFTAQIIESVDVGHSLKRLALHVPAEVSSSFHAAGQYHRVRVGTEHNLFAIASAPGSPRFEYLIRRSPGVAERWAALHRADQVEVTRAEGPGFPLALAEARPLVMVATGTGFAPIRSVLEAIVPRRSQFQSVKALVGVRTVDEVEHWRHDTQRWAQHGLEVHWVVSKPPSEFRGQVGHVQAHLKPLQLEGAIAFLCGQNEMVAEVTAHLVARGVAAERVFLNVGTW